MSDGYQDSDDLDWDEVAAVPDESDRCYATVPDEECEADAELRFAASDQAHDGATPLRSAHDAREKRDDDFEEGETTIGGATLLLHFVILVFGWTGVRISNRSEA